MQEYKREFIKFLESAGVLRFGDFTAKSGRKIPYFINAGDIKTGAQMKKLGEYYAKAYTERLGNRKNVLFGPAYKGIPIEAKDHGEGGVFVGYTPKDGENIVITEDVITAGTAIRESMDILSPLKGSKVVAAFVMVDRKEKGRGELSAIDEVEKQYGFPVYSIVDVYDIIEYLELEGGNEQNVRRIRDYLEVYGASGKES